MCRKPPWCSSCEELFSKEEPGIAIRLPVSGEDFVFHRRCLPIVARRPELSNTEKRYLLDSYDRMVSVARKKKR